MTGGAPRPDDRRDVFVEGGTRLRRAMPATAERHETKPQSTPTIARHAIVGVIRGLCGSTWTSWTSIALLSPRKPAPRHARRSAPKRRAVDASETRSTRACAHGAGDLRASRSSCGSCTCCRSGTAPFFSVLMGDSHGYDEWAQRIAGGDWLGQRGVLSGAAVPVSARRHLRDRRAPPAARPHRADRHRVGVVRAARRSPSRACSRAASLPPAAVPGSSPG